MNIQPMNSYNISAQGKPNGRGNGIGTRITQKILDVLPSHTQKESAKKLDKWNKIDNWASKPMQNRGIMGVTALLTQPFIDYNNKKVDEETRKMAALNRCAVILAGTSVGMFVVRGPLYTAVEKMTDLKGESKFSKALLPKKYLSEMSKNEKFVKNYRSALSMAVALGAMFVTNFVLDAPLTIFLTNYFKEKFAERHEEKQAQNVAKEISMVSKTGCEHNE